MNKEELKGFEEYINSERSAFVTTILKYYPHEVQQEHKQERIDIRVAAENLLIAFDQMKQRLFNSQQSRDSQPLPDMKELRERFKKENGKIILGERKLTVGNMYEAEQSLDKIFDWFEREFKGVVEKEVGAFVKWRQTDEGCLAYYKTSGNFIELYQLYLQSKNTTESSNVKG